MVFGGLWIFGIKPFELHHNNYLHHHPIKIQPHCSLSWIPIHYFTPSLITDQALDAPHEWPQPLQLAAVVKPSPRWWPSNLYSPHRKSILSHSTISFPHHYPSRINNVDTHGNRLPCRVSDWRRIDPATRTVSQRPPISTPPLPIGMMILNLLPHILLKTYKLLYFSSYRWGMLLNKRFFTGRVEKSSARIWPSITHTPPSSHYTIRALC